MVYIYFVKIAKETNSFFLIKNVQPAKVLTQESKTAYLTKRKTGVSEFNHQLLSTGSPFLSSSVFDSKSLSISAIKIASIASFSVEIILRKELS